MAGPDDLGGRITGTLLGQEGDPDAMDGVQGIDPREIDRAACRGAEDQRRASIPFQKSGSIALDAS